MGLYQSLDHMVANGLLDGFSKSNTEILSMPLVKYIYKLTWSPDGYYYIGQTNNLKDHFYRHILSIADCRNENNKTVKPFHRFIDETMRPHYEKADYGRKKKPPFEIFIRHNTSAYIWAIAGDQESANVLQAYYLNLYKSDPLCLNIRF